MVMKNIKILAAPLFIFLVFCSCGNVSAQSQSSSAPVPTESNGGCGNPNYYQYSLLAPKTVSGSLYVRLPKGTKPSDVQFFTQDGLSSECSQIGSSTVGPDLWVKLGQVNITESQTNLVAVGSALGAEPYAAAIQALIVPDSKVCMPSNDCMASYAGLNGYIKPKLISGDTDSIALFSVSSLSDSTIKSVQYFADNKFLYKKDALAPINKNYLNNGVHDTSIQAQFSNGEVFIVNQKVDAGQSWPGVAYLRTMYFKSSNQIKIFMLAGMFIISGLLVVVIARIIHIKLLYRNDHGFNNYHNVKPEIKHVEAVVRDIESGDQ
jgi:hypothetical protein